MKNKIAIRLTLYFAAVLLAFSLIVGALFFFLFTGYTERRTKADLESRATTISATLSGFTTNKNNTLEPKLTTSSEPANGSSIQSESVQSEEKSMGNSQGKGQGKGKHDKNNTLSETETLSSATVSKISDTSKIETPSDSEQNLMQHGSGYGAYMRFLDDIAMTDVWIVDKNLQQIQRGHGQANLPYTELPQTAENVIKEVYTGKTACNEGFNEVLNAPTITVGAPIYNKSNEIIGAVLLHSPIAGVSNAVKNGFAVLFLSMLVSLILCVAMAILFSLSFTRPLNKMKITANKLSGGDYTAKTEVDQSDEIGELAKTIDILAEKLSLAEHEREKLDQLRNNFISNISHELRTPITVIRGSLEAICDGVVVDAAQINEYHAQMLADSINLQRLVNDLLELSRLQNLDFAIDMLEINLFEVVSDSIRSMRRIADAKNIAIELQSEKNDYTITADYGRIRQMLMILLDNAIKFSDNGKRIRLTIVGDTHAILTVADEGCGIEPADLPYVFDRFHKQKSEQNKTGTGLGLAIAKQISQRHNINMTVSSELGHGTAFKMEF